MAEYRTEKDTLGDVQVPAAALYGAQTQRAKENFQISGIRFPRVFIRSLGMIKGTAAEVNSSLGLLDGAVAEAIRAASLEVEEGRWDDQFPLDIFQTGSGTSTNMNANEVIAALADLALDNTKVHPNDHVNMGQSSNDVIPTAIHLSAALLVRELLLPSLNSLHETLLKKAEELRGVVKTGRTHLMDAVPVRMDQEIGGWAFQVRQGIERIEGCLPRLHRLATGGTAVGTGINAHREFGRRMAEGLALRTGIGFTETENHFAAQAALDAAVELSGALSCFGSSLLKIANDLRWMNSGPLAGIGEIALPALQPGSSIMPAKVNPVICEAVIMASVQVMANNTAITMGNAMGNFELNTMMPLISHNLLQSLTILSHAASSLADKAVAGFVVNDERITDSLERNPILATALNPVVGYEKAALIAKKAAAEGKRIKDLAGEMTGISGEEIDRILDPLRMTGEEG